MGRGKWTKPLMALAALAWGWMANAAWAADAAAHESGHGGILDARWDLGIWTIVVFVLLYVILRYVKLPGASEPALVAMLQGLQQREQNIRDLITETQQARDEAQQLRKQFEAEVAKAHEKVRDILDVARRDAQQVGDDMVAKARAEIQGERDRLRKEIDTARDQALQQLWSQTAQLAALISAKAVRRDLNLEDHRRLMDDALAELRTAGNNRQRQVASARS